jgi:hypothetical protein
VDARKSVFAGGFRACVHPVPVDAHSAPCYPIQPIKSLFRLRVDRARSGRPSGRATCLRMLPSGTGFAAGAALRRRGRDDQMGQGGNGCSE